MRNAFLLAAAAVLMLPSAALATWSVIAVDRFLPGVQAVVVPGMGVAACQAAVDGTHQNQMLVFAELLKGTDPKAIIELLSKDPAFQSRQFGILDVQGRGARHSGLANGYVSQDAHGRAASRCCSGACW